MSQMQNWCCTMLCMNECRVLVVRTPIKDSATVHPESRYTTVSVELRISDNHNDYRSHCFHRERCAPVSTCTMWRRDAHTGVPRKNSVTSVFQSCYVIINRTLLDFKTDRNAWSRPGTEIQSTRNQEYNHHYRAWSLHIWGLLFVSYTLVEMPFSILSRRWHTASSYTHLLGIIWSVLLWYADAHVRAPFQPYNMESSMHVCRGDECVDDTAR